MYLNPFFIPAPDLLFSSLKADVIWDERMKARKTASFGVSYKYSKIAYEPSLMPSEIGALCAKVATELGFQPNNCLINFYPDGDSSMEFHSDAIEGLAPGTGGAIISVGNLRSIVFRNKLERTCEFPFPLPSGSLL